MRSRKANFSLIICLLTLILPQSEGYNFCYGKAVDLCANISHFMCNVSVIEPMSEYLAHVPMTRKIRRILLEKHNIIRDNVASGNVTTFPKASSMRELIWDQELAYMAHEHAGRCSVEGDACRNTARFPQVGQNLAFSSMNERRLVADVIEDVFAAWFKEHETITDPPKVVEKYEEGLETAKNFTVIINEQVSRVGCAIGYCQNCDEVKHCYYTTCNYDMTNVVGTRIYLTDPEESAGKCIEWDTDKSANYENLCHNTGKIYKVFGDKPASGDGDENPPAPPPGPGAAPAESVRF